MNQVISEATRRNWEKLNLETNGRLESRANKRMSKKYIFPAEYCDKRETVPVLRKIAGLVQNKGWACEDVLYSLGIRMLEKSGIYAKAHVQRVLKEYSGCKRICELDQIDLPKEETDVLGLVYQSLQAEGRKNEEGSYYTPRCVTECMTKNLDFSDGQTILDPCCGSGAFFLSLKDVQPEQIYGIDRDYLAVMICKINLLLKFSDCVFIPQIVCGDYLALFSERDSALSIEENEVVRNRFQEEFNYIVTNPPWGAVTDRKNVPEKITSGESFSCIFVNACRQLVRGGIIRFLFPESVLRVKAHRDIRAFMLDELRLEQITLYDGLFCGVTTKYVDICCRKTENLQAVKERHPVRILHGDDSMTVFTDVFRETQQLVFHFWTEKDAEIIRKVRNQGKYNLDSSIWGLGIVTGDNKNKLKDQKIPGSEAIYTGKEIRPYRLKEARKYLVFDKTQLQQTAREEIYRAPEKLVYRFISRELIFACDDRQQLFLNSANILIPKIPGMSIKTVMAFLNSNLFQYVYDKLFGELKVLKGNLMQLPFPEITPEEDEKIRKLTERLMAGDDEAEMWLQEEIYRIFALTEKEIRYIESERE